MTPNQPEAADVPCPHCRGAIKSGATICKHSKETVAASTAPPPQSAAGPSAPAAPTPTANSALVTHGAGPTWLRANRPLAALIVLLCAGAGAFACKRGGEQVVDDDYRRGAAAWQESLVYEDVSKYFSKLRELGGGTDEGQAKMAEFTADLHILMAKKAGKQRGDGKMETWAGAEQLAREAAQRKKIDWEQMSAAHKQSALALAARDVGDLSGNQDYASPPRQR